MPNWSYNTTEITGDAESIATLRSAIEETRDDEAYNDEAYSLLRTFIPRPDTFPTNEGWLFWSLDNWGCKWADTNQIGDETDERITLIGQTPWSPPCKGYLAVSAMFPTLTFRLGYSEEGMAFLGATMFRNGEVLATIDYNADDEGFPVFDEDDDGYYSLAIAEKATECWEGVLAIAASL